MRDALNDNLFELEKIHTDHNGSDMLTKSLPRESLKFVIQSLGWRVPPHNRKGGDLLGFSSCGKPKLRAQNFKAS